ncbi:filamentous hemagglutinin family protein [Tardiphaga sp. 172_B4_N1_3]|uniref:filamentous haemagglutinin family protein n=1 Tax=Tardiphaga sp. 172_B4_N1_3 TaxID=3240787 RepID=UPI003F8957C6
MSVLPTVSCGARSPRSHFDGRRAALLVGVSIVTLSIAAGSAQARSLQGGSGASPTAATAMAATAAQAAAQQAAQTASQAMVRASNALQNMRNMQSAARAAAMTAATTVPNGLTPGGLVVAPNVQADPTLWRGARLPTQTTSGGRTQVEIRQTDSKAILTWEKFNIGRDTDLYFNQTAGGADVANWVALNRVIDPSLAPSQILGTIKAEGQVYVVNRNGIIFGGSSQVNVHTLVASSLGLSNAQFTAGVMKTLLTDPNVLSPLPTFGDAATERNPTLTPAVYGTTPGSVLVEAGALIESHVGGKAMLFAPRVVNAGTIRTPGGQTLMAAGENVWLFASPTSTTSTALRGIEVAASAPMPFMMSYDSWTWDGAQPQVKAAYAAAMDGMEARAASIGYSVGNTGMVEAARGNITVVGRSVAQNGVMLASTALNNQDGSIVLRAWSQGVTAYDANIGNFLYSFRAGTLSLGGGSLTTVMPDLTDTGTLEQSAVATRYRAGSIDLRGNLIDIQAGAALVAPSGSIAAVASKQPILLNEPPDGEKSVADGSRLYIGEGALLSVAGLRDVLLTMESNSVKAELRINELRDSVLYIDSWLRGATVYVDKRNGGTFADGPMAGVQWLKDSQGNYLLGKWAGTPLADVSGWIGTGLTTLAELSTKGGTINLKSGGDIIVRTNAVLDVSGGSVRYADGYITTTKLRGVDGRIYDIGNALPDQQYIGLAGGFSRYHARIDVTETWTSPLDRHNGTRFEQGYTEGRGAGGIYIYHGAGLAMDGEVDGRVIAGERQVAGGEVAVGGVLQIGGDDPVSDSPWLTSSLILSSAPTRLADSFNVGSALPAAYFNPVGTSQPASRAKTTWLDSGMLNKSGMGTFNLFFNKSFIQEEGANLDLSAGATLNIQKIGSPSIGFLGSIAMNGNVRIAGGKIYLLADDGIVIGDHVKLDTSGQWLNEYESGTPAGAVKVNGGEIKIEIDSNATISGFGGKVNIARTALLDVSGGGWLSNRNNKQKLQLGDAGAVTLANLATSVADIDLRAFAAGSGGSFKISTVGTVQVGGAIPADPAIIYLPATLLAERGFRSVQIDAKLENVTFADGVTISQTPVSIDLAGAELTSAPSGAKLTDFGRVRVLDLPERISRKPTSLTVSSPKTITVGVGTTLSTDVKGSISFLETSTRANPTANGTAVIAGNIDAPAGSISISATTLRVSSDARFTARGVAAIVADPRTGVLSGKVLDGGTVSLNGAMTLGSGVLIDVSGTSGVIDDPLRRRGNGATIALASNGGTIALKGGQSASSSIDARLLATSGGQGAASGRLVISNPSFVGSAGNFASSDLFGHVSLIGANGADMTASLDAINGGGFSAISLSALYGLRIGNGAVLDAPTAAVSIFGAIIAPRPGASAEIRAGHLSLKDDVTGAGAAAGTGTLLLKAGVIDVSTAAFRGYASTTLVAGDLRLLTPEFDIRGGTITTGRGASLDADGMLTLQAAQIYPSTQATATITATNRIFVRANGAATVPLSAGGNLTLRAPDIDISGSIRVPFGSLTLSATNSITLGAGAIISVSGDGLDVPYGLLVNRESWAVQVKKTDTLPTVITAPPDKKILIDAPSVNVAAGSTIDIHGGGNIHASEFVLGSGGSHDILAMPNTYAIMPAFASATTPGSDVGSRIWLAGGNGLAAGWYNLMPAKYALMPGAFAIQMVAGSTGYSVAMATPLTDGAVLMSGRLGNSINGATDAQASNWRVMSGGVVRAYSEYNEANANTFFSSETFRTTQYRLSGRDPAIPGRPMDGGSVVFKASRDLMLEGQLKSQAADGARGGLLDISATNIAVVGAGQDRTGLTGYLIIDSARLSSFGAGSLLLGGTRTSSISGVTLTVGAGSIVIRNDAGSALTGPEIILGATDTITIADGSVLRAQGVASSNDSDLTITPQVATPARDYGALIRLSNGSAVNVLRTNIDKTATGTVAIGAGAAIDGGNALLIDATRNTTLSGSAIVSARDITLSGSSIGFGGGNSGLVFSANALAQFNRSQNLTLRSYSSIDFYTGADFGAAGLKSVTLDTAGIVGRNPGAIVINGDTVVLRNTSGTFVDPLVADQGTLALSANQLVLGSGAKNLRGFGAVALTGQRSVSGQGEGSLNVGQAAVSLVAPVVTGQNGSNQSIVTSGGLAVVGADRTAARDLDSLGSRWAFNGGSVDFDGRIDAIAGGVSLTATSGNLIMRSNAIIDVGGFTKAFNDVSANVNAGTINLTAVGGGVIAGAGSLLNLAAAVGGGDAGTLAVTSSGAVVLGGTIDARSEAGKGGSFAIDISALADFAGLARQLEGFGFSRAQTFRIRTGDVVLDGVSKAESFALSADAGKVTITGAVDASAAYGGNILISAGNGIAMTGTANLAARSTTALGSGRVVLDASGGALGISGGMIDVSGGQKGSVRFRALQNGAHNDVAVSNLQVDIRGSRSSILEGVAVYVSTDGTVGSQLPAAVTNAGTFTAATPGIRSRIANGIDVMAGIEIRSAGDLSLTADIDLANTFSAHEGTLTLRAAGNLNVTGNISDGFSNATRTGALLDQASWDIRLVGGADLAAADALTVKSLGSLAANSGSVTIGNAATGYVVRTGTGDLAVRAGRDINLAHYQSVIYTAGRKDTIGYAGFTAPAAAVYGILGGNLQIDANGSIISALPAVKANSMLFTDWLKKEGVVGTDLRFTKQTTWWVDHSRFNQGVGTLGGGNVNVKAGGNLENLMVALATTGRVSGGITADDGVVHMDNGGAMNVAAGGAVKAGYYYVARGAGSIDAGSFATGRQVTISAARVVTVYDIAPVLSLGDARLDVRTNGELRVQTVLDPLMAYDPAKVAQAQTLIVGETGASRLNLTSIGGDVTLLNQASFLTQDLTYTTASLPTSPTAYLNQFAGNLYPAQTRIVSLSGSISNLGRIATLPGATSDLTLLAAQNITAGTIVMARATPAMLPSYLRPFGGPAVSFLANTRFVEQRFLDLLRNPIDPIVDFGANNPYFRSVNNPDVLLNAGDMEPSRFYALNGSILRGVGLVQLGAATLAKTENTIFTNEQMWMSAGKDIRDLNLDLRHLHATDVSTFNAGNDFIHYNTRITQDPQLAPAVVIQGPGAIVVTAGRDIYGDALIVRSNGNKLYDATTNEVRPNTTVKGLPDSGASIEMIAGLQGKQPDYAAMARLYLDPTQVGSMPAHLTKMVDGQLLPLYLTDDSRPTADGVKQTRSGLVSFMRDMTGRTLSPRDAWAAFQTLPVLTQQRFLRQVYMQELREAGRDHNNGGATGGYKRGYAAIATLFPGDGWKGDVQSGNALFRTMAGRNIEIMTPGGGLQVAALNQSVPAGYGLITLGYGKIDIFAKKNVVVNRSRALTFSGGDVTIWSTVGDIDAGRGAKTTRVDTPPAIITNDVTVTRLVEKSGISGAGIGTVVGYAGVEPGDLDLIAPSGTVDAGDAGIRVAGNFNVAALIVLNADNIKVGGESKGVPKPQAPVVNLTAETKDKAAADAVKDTTQQPGNDRPSVIIVEVLGYGGGSDGDTERRKYEEDEARRRRSDKHDQDPTSRVQVLAVGDLSQEEIGRLAEVQRPRQGR